MAPLTVTAAVLGPPHAGSAAVSYRADFVLPTLLLGGMPPAAGDIHAAGYALNARREDSMHSTQLTWSAVFLPIFGATF